MSYLDSLEKMFNSSVPNDGVILDASDFAALATIDLGILNNLILEVGHELYDPGATHKQAQVAVVSLINLGLLSRDRIFESCQYA